MQVCCAAGGDVDRIGDVRRSRSPPGASGSACSALPGFDLPLRVARPSSRRRRRRARRCGRARRRPRSPCAGSGGGRRRRRARAARRAVADLAAGVRAPAGQRAGRRPARRRAATAADSFATFALRPGDHARAGAGPGRAAVAELAERCRRPSSARRAVGAQRAREVLARRERVRGSPVSARHAGDQLGQPAIVAGRRRRAGRCRRRPSRTRRPPVVDRAGVQRRRPRPRRRRRSPATRTGSARGVRVPSPSWPRSLRPQHQRLSSRAHAGRRVRRPRSPASIAFACARRRHARVRVAAGVVRRSAGATARSPRPGRCSGRSPRRSRRSLPIVHCACSVQWKSPGPMQALANGAAAPARPPPRRARRRRSKRAPDLQPARSDRNGDRRGGLRAPAGAPPRTARRRCAVSAVPSASVPTPTCQRDSAVDQR